MRMEAFVWNTRLRMERGVGVAGVWTGVFKWSDYKLRFHSFGGRCGGGFIYKAEF
jgi:hypothetical protein